MRLYIGAFANCVYVSVEGNDWMDCGSQRKPCRSLSFAIKSISRHNDTIYLIGNHATHVMYMLESTIVIIHSLTITKFPKSCINPVIAHHINMKSNLTKDFAFKISSSNIVSNNLSLNFNSVNFNVNILTAFSENTIPARENMVTDISSFPLWLSISESIIISPSDSINLGDTSGYGNVSIHVKDSIIENGVLMFDNKRKTCPCEDNRNKIEMINVTFSKAKNVALFINGCFDVSLNKFIFTNITLKKQPLFTFKGVKLNLRNILFKTLAPDNNTDNNKSEVNVFFLICESTAKIMNLHVKGCKVRSSMYHQTALLVQNSTVEMYNIELTNTSFQNFVQTENTTLSIKNISLTKNNFRKMLWSVEKSNVELHDIKLEGNRLQSFLDIDKNSKVLSARNIPVTSEIFKNLNYTVKNSVKVKNAVICNNQINTFMATFSESYIFFKNAELSNNVITKAIYHLTRKSKLEIDNVVFLQNNIRTDLLYMTSNSAAIMQNSILTKNIVSRTVYNVSNMSTIRLCNATFIRNDLMTYLFDLSLNSDAIIQNITLNENKILLTAYRFFRKSTIKLTNATFTQNDLTNGFLFMSGNSTAIIRNKTMTKNKISSWCVYCIFGMSTIIIKNVAFTRNNVRGEFMTVSRNSNANIQNKTLTENKISSLFVYYINEMSTIMIKNAAFTRNNVTCNSMMVVSRNSNANIQNKTMTENNIFSSISMYFISTMSNIIIKNAAFTRNNVTGDLMSVLINSNATIQNKTLTENRISKNVYSISKKSTIIIINVAFTRNIVTHVLLYVTSNSNVVLQNNSLTENDVSQAVCHFNENSAVQMNNVTFTGNNVRKYLLFMDQKCNVTLINNTIIGNKYLKWVFYLDSSNLAIDTILVRSNTLKHLIWATYSNVNVSSITVRENNIEEDIIYTVNCGGSLANSFIENCDFFSVSAFSITCSYEAQIYRPFEITNTEIMWNSKLPFSARPIVKLSGKITISNVTISVSSISEVTVVEYSTDVTRVKQKGSVKIYRHKYNISLLFVSCVKSNVENFIRLNTIRCIPCARGRYTFNNGFLLISSMNFESKRAIIYKKSNATCLDCPVGANCTASIKSKSNFYGYKAGKQKLRFLPCPRGFCCTGNQCVSITSCDKKRTGYLCGTCIENFTVSFLSTECISKYSCKSFMTFWVTFCIYALVVATFLYYMKDLINLLKTTGNIISTLFQPCLKTLKRKTKENEEEIDEVIVIVGAEKDLEETRHFTASGIFALIISFYQIKQVITVDVEHKNLSYFTFNTFVSRVVNLEIIAISSSFYCPMNNLNAVSKVFIKTYLVTCALLVASLLHYFISRCSFGFCSKFRRGSSLQPLDRLGVCFLRILMLSYKNIATVSLTLFNCVKFAGTRVLYIKGDVECFQWWQITLVVFFCTWILFFPLSLKCSYQMFIKDEITFPQFICCLVAPCALVAYFLLNRNSVSVDLQQSRNVSEVKMILKEMFEECYRFKTVDIIEETEEAVFYETWRLYQRVILAIVATFFVNPLIRVTFMAPVITLIALSYLVYRPYKPEMYILHWMEVVSIFGIFFCLTHNMMRGFLFIYDINDEYPITLLWHAFGTLDLLFSPICVLFYFFIIKPIFIKARKCFKQKRM